MERDDPEADWRQRQRGDGERKKTNRKQCRETPKKKSMFFFLTILLKFGGSCVGVLTLTKSKDFFFFCAWVVNFWGGRVVLFF